MHKPGCPPVETNKRLETSWLKCLEIFSLIFTFFTNSSLSSRNSSIENLKKSYCLILLKITGVDTFPNLELMPIVENDITRQDTPLLSVKAIKNSSHNGQLNLKKRCD